MVATIDIHPMWLVVLILVIYWLWRTREVPRGG